MNSPVDLKADYIGKTASDDDDVPDFEEIPVWVDPSGNDDEGAPLDSVGEVPDPDLDSFAVIERDDGLLQYGRVSSGYEYSARADPSVQQRDTSMGYDPRPVRESALDEDVYRLIRVELLGEVVFEEDGYTVRRPSKLPQVGRKVYELGATELANLLEMPDEETGLDIGTIESGGESVPFRIDPGFMSRHVAILGRTGVGKTHTGHVIIEELINYDEPDEPGVPVVTFDAEEDVANMADDVGGVTLNPEEIIMPVPFQLIGWSEFDRFLGSMASDMQRQVIGRAYSRVHNEALEELEERGQVDVGMAEFERYVHDAADAFDYNYGGQAANRATAVVNGSDVLAEGMNDWAELLVENPIVNIDIGNLGDANRGAVISAVSRMLRILREEDQIPPFVLAIDEAHEFVPAGQSSESTAVVRDLVKTARHIGVGVMLMTQSPSELDSRTLRTCNTYITLALADPEVNEIKGLLSDLSDRSLDQIPNMEQGRAFVGAARDIMTHTVPVNVRDRDSPEGAPTPNLVEDSSEWRDDYDEDGGE
jgi:DNA helicase HerA-like ATPase